MIAALRAQHTLAEVLRVVAADALSEFEEALIVEIAARRARFGDEAQITDIEADILAIAIENMEASIARVVAANQAEFAEACRRASVMAGGPW